MYVHLGRAEPAPRQSAPTRSVSSPSPLVRVRDTRTAEFNAVCRVHVRLANGHSYGSGVLIGPHHVLTSAHVIYQRGYPSVEWVRVYQAQNGPQPERNGVRSNGWAVSRHWNAEQCESHDHDLAIIRLATPINSGIWPVEQFDPSRLNGEAAFLAGYPGRADDPTATRMYRSRGRVRAAFGIVSCGLARIGSREPDSITTTPLTRVSDTSRLVAHDAPSASSMSGGPLWSFIDGRKTLWGIHAGVLPGGVMRKAVLLNSDVRRQIDLWVTRTVRAL